MKITMNKNETTLTVVLQGRLDTLTAPELEEELEPALEHIEKLIFDFSELKYISSAGLRVLLSAMQVMENQGEMIVKNVSSAVMEIFEVTGFTDYLIIE